MPVMTRIITADSGSRRNARSSVKSPEAIHVNSVCVRARDSTGRPARAITCMTATAKAATITADARPPETALGSRRPSEALTRKPANGRRGISDSTGSPLERREGFRVERLAVAEERNHQREAHGGFGGRDRHHEEGDDLAVDGAELAPEGDEGQVHGVEHDLHRQQQGDHVTPQEDAG